MTDNIGAPGTEFSRRDLMRATGSAGLLGLAGCSTPSSDAPSSLDQQQKVKQSGLSPAGAPQVVDVTEQYLDLAKTYATRADSPLTGIAVEYIYRSGEPDVLPGSP